MKRFAPSRNFKISERSAGDLTFNGTSYVDVDNNLDLAIKAAIGDVLELGLSTYWNNGATGAFIDAVTIVSGSPVNYMSGNGSTGEGVMSWQSYNNREANAYGGTHYTVVSGDRVSGLVTVRLRARTETANNKVLAASSTRRLRFWVKNIGKVDPN